MKNMCNYQALFHDDNTGYVVRCNECEKIQVGFSNLVITFTTSDFDSFRWWLQKIKDEQHPSQKTTVRNIMIPTPCEGMRLLLSFRELNEFNNMLETADTELKSLQFIKLFDNH